MLCGGRSSRMGTDKSLLAYEGVPMARRAADVLLAAGCDEVIAIGGDVDALGALGLSVVADGWPGEGPVGGVLTALRARPAATHVVVMACDLPRMTPATVRSLIAALEDAPEAVVAAARTDRLEPMCAVWRPSASPALEDALTTGERRLHAVIGTLDAVQVPVPSADLANINAPGDLPSRL